MADGYAEEEPYALEQTIFRESAIAAEVVERTESRRKKDDVVGIGQKSNVWWRNTKAAA
jgi:hypothetical protein